MFGQCCQCQDPQERANQISYDPVAEQHESGNQFFGEPMKANQNPLPPLQEEPPMSQRSASSLTPEEKAVEKARLQELVKKFAKAAVNGISCELLKAEGKKVQAKYSIDKKLQRMTVTNQENAQDTRTFALANVNEIYRFEDGDSFFPMEARRLSESDKDRVMVVSYMMEGGKEENICFLEAAAIDKERFVTCMKILRLYAQTNTPNSGGN